MPKTAINTIDLKSFVVLIVISMTVIVASITIGSFVAPSPWTHTTVKGRKCMQAGSSDHQLQWFVPWGEGGDPGGDGEQGGCRVLPNITTNRRAALTSFNVSLHDIVFAFQFPPRDTIASRWQQRLAGLLRLRLRHEEGSWWAAADTRLHLVTRLGYLDEAGAAPTLLAQRVQDRHVACHLRKEHSFDGCTYDCAPMPLLVLYSLHHHLYLINIKVAASQSLQPFAAADASHIQDLYVSFISQRGEYVKVVVALQTVFFPTVVALLAWYLRLLCRAAAPLTYFQLMLLALISALLLINCPWTYLTLLLDCPWLLILQELSLGIFYGTIMTFLHFLTYLYIEPVQRCPKVRTAMAQVIGGYTSTIFLIDFMEHAVLVRDPLPYVWESLHLGLATITVLLVLAYLTYITARVCSAVRAVRGRGGGGAGAAAWRETAMLAVSWLCLLLTVVEFIIKRLHDGMWIWEDIFGNLEIQNTSGLLLGVYSMWNVFTCVVVIVYPPVTHVPHPDPDSEVTSERHLQLQPRLRPRPPLRRQDAIDIVSEDSIEFVATSNGMASLFSQEGERRPGPATRSGLVSGADAVSVYQASGDSPDTVWTAPATAGSSAGKTRSSGLHTADSAISPSVAIAGAARVEVRGRAVCTCPGGRLRGNLSCRVHDGVPSLSFDDELDIAMIDDDPTC